MSTNRLLLSSFTSAALLAACTHSADNGSQTSPPGKTVLSAAALKSAETKVDFGAHVKPIFEAKCVMCHNRKTLPGRMSLENKKLAMSRGATGMPIWPGYPQHSQILTKVKTAHAHVNAMPPVGERITKEEVAVLTKWIKDGAEWPDGRSGKLDPNWKPKE